MQNKTSIVVTSRNDNYGGYLKERAEHALNTMLNHYDEVIYVDWCSEKESLASIIDIQKTKRFRHIIVTQNDLKKIAPQTLDIAIVEVLGRNIGIRRSTGDWIVSSNIDILPESLPTNLNDYTLYVAPRFNVPKEVFLSCDKDLYSECVNNKFHLKRAPIIENDVWAGRYDPWSKIVCCGDFQAAHKDLWHKMRGFEESLIFRDCADTNLMKKGIIYGDAAEIIDLNVFHLDHSGHGGQSGGVSIKNDWDSSVVNFNETSNSENWGFCNYNFFEEVI